MSRGFVRGALVFGAVAAAALAAYVRVGMGQTWPQVVRAWVFGFAALALAPFGVTFFSPLFWGWMIGRHEARGTPRRRDREGGYPRLRRGGEMAGSRQMNSAASKLSSRCR